MSVINQVLNQLEQRGAHTAPERSMVRAVPHSQHKPAITMPLLVLGVALGVALAAGVVSWQWMQARKQQVVTASIVQTQPAKAITAPAPAPVHAPAPVAAPLVAVESVAVSAPLATVPLDAIAANTASAVSADENLSAEVHTSASRPSFELVPIPLSSSPAQDSGEAVRNAKKSVASKKASAKTELPARPAKPKSTETPAPIAQAEKRPVEVVSPIKQVSPAQQADAEFRKAVALMQQGHVTDAMAGYEAALRLDAGHDAARQALVALLLESGRGMDAGRVLQDGLRNKPEHTGFAMLLARLQVEQGAVDLAVATLEKSLPYAKLQADYQAFFAALLQRQNRHKEAIAYYQIALQLVPNNGVWLMGHGISLQAMQRADDAKIAFRRALESKTLSPDLQEFVEMKLREL